MIASAPHSTSESASAGSFTVHAQTAVPRSWQTRIKEGVTSWRCTTAADAAARSSQRPISLGSVHFIAASPPASRGANVRRPDSP